MAIYGIFQATIGCLSHQVRPVSALLVGTRVPEELTNEFQPEDSLVSSESIVDIVLDLQ